MRFSTVTLVLALAGSSCAQAVVRRIPAPFLPRGLAARDNSCGTLAPGMSCCGTNAGNIYACPQAAPFCVTGDNGYWCCPQNQQNCAKTACGSNNGNCGSGYTCSTDSNGNAQCNPQNPYAVVPQASGSAQTASAATAAPAAATPAANTTSSASPSTATGSGSSGSQTVPPPAQASSSGTKLSGISALALALMAGVLLL